MGKYKVYVYAICKNEEKFVDEWMASMSEADQVIVTDTGSEDKTVERLKDKGAIVYEQVVTPWRFDVARNISLSHVPTDADICVCTDLDERFEPGWREALEKAWNHEACQAKYIYNWSLKPDGTPHVQFMYFKIHTRNEYVWAYPCHEVLQYIGARPLKEVIANGVVLNHYPDPTKSRGSYLGLLKLAVEEHPEDDRMTYYLGREYTYKARWKAAIDTLTHYLTLKTATWNEERASAMRFIALSYSMLQNINEAYKWYYRAIAEVSWVRDGYMEFAKFAYRIGDYKTLYFMATEALKITKKSETYVNEGDSWDSTPYDLASIGAFYIGLYEKSYEYAKQALAMAPTEERLKTNLKLIEGTMKAMKDSKTG